MTASISRITRVIPALLLLLGSASVSQAQTVATTIEQLTFKVKAGDTIYVTDQTGREMTASIVAISPSLLTVKTAGTLREFSAADVQRIRQRLPDSLWTGGLIGLAIGAGLGITAATFSEECSPHVSSSCAGPVLWMAGIGTGVGIGIDALVQGRKVIYQASARRPDVQVSVVPVITGKMTGAGVIVRF